MYTFSALGSGDGETDASPMGPRSTVDEMLSLSLELQAQAALPSGSPTCCTQVQPFTLVSGIRVTIKRSVRWFIGYERR